MWDYWKKDIKRAFWIAVSVSIVAIFINWIRTPILYAIADNTKMTKATANMYKGVWLIDDWTHDGWPGVQKSTMQGEQISTVPDENISAGQSEDVNDSGIQIEIETDPQLWPIDILMTKDFYDSGECVFFDARMPEYYEEGHITGSYNWPYDDFDSYYYDYIEQFDLDTCIVVYCIGGPCDESYHLGTSLIIEGYSEVYLFQDGMEGWITMGWPVTIGPDPE